jgi:hypothetical protein
MDPVKYTRRTSASEFQQNRQPLPTANRYTVLSNLKEPEAKTTTYHQTNGNYKKKIVKTNTLRHKVFIIGDSHIRGIATKLQRDLEEDCSVYGIVKPGADLTAILGSDMI